MKKKNALCGSDVFYFELRLDVLADFKKRSFFLQFAKIFYSQNKRNVWIIVIHDVKLNIPITIFIFIYTFKFSKRLYQFKIFFRQLISVYEINKRF